MCVCVYICWPPVEAPRSKHQATSISKTPGLQEQRPRFFKGHDVQQLPEIQAKQRDGTPEVTGEISEIMGIFLSIEHLSPKNGQKIR